MNGRYEHDFITYWNIRYNQETLSLKYGHIYWDWRWSLQHGEWLVLIMAWRYFFEKLEAKILNLNKRKVPNISYF